MLALSSPQSLCLPPGHANTPRIFQVGQRPCWRRPPRKAFALRRVTPTRPGFSRPTNVHVGANLPAILCLPPNHANKLRLILVALTIDILAGTSEE